MDFNIFVMKDKQTETKIAFYSSIAIICIIIFLSLTSCKAKIQTIETHSTDTIYKSEVIKIDKPQLNKIFLDNICDSLGNLRPFKITYGTKSNNTTLIGKDNVIYLEQNVDSIVNSEIEKYKSSIKTEKEVIIKTVKRPFNLYSIILNVVLLLWTFRKPLLRLVKPI